MARVTVEDCLDNVDNRFQLVLVATKRARQIANGKEPMVPWENDKPTVVALREIADGLVDRSILEEEEAQAAVEEKEEQATGMGAEGVAEMAANTVAEVSISIEEEAPADNTGAISEEE